VNGLAIHTARRVNIYLLFHLALSTGNCSGLKTSFDLSPFANGVYFVEIMQGEKIAMKQLVVNQ
jgi:hypothetical protein